MKSFVLFMLVMFFAIPVFGQDDGDNSDEFLGDLNELEEPTLAYGNTYYLDIESNCGKVVVRNYNEDGVDGYVAIVNDGEYVYDRPISLEGGESIELDDVPEGYIVEVNGVTAIDDVVRHGNDIENCDGSITEVRDSVQLNSPQSDVHFMLDAIEASGGFENFDVNQVSLHNCSGDNRVDFYLGEQWHYPVEIDSQNGFRVLMYPEEWLPGNRMCVFLRGEYVAMIEFGMGFGNISNMWLANE